MDNYQYYLKHSFKEYEGKWIAIKESKVVVADKNFKALVKKLKSKDLKLSEVSIASIPPKDVALIYSPC